MTSLQTFNAFGLLKITNKDVIVTMTAMKADGKPVNRAFGKEFDNPIEIGNEVQSITATVAIMIDQNSDFTVAIHEMETLGEIAVRDIPEAGQAIAQVAKMIKASL